MGGPSESRRVVCLAHTVTAGTVTPAPGRIKEMSATWELGGKNVLEGTARLYSTCRTLASFSCAFYQRT